METKKTDLLEIYLRNEAAEAIRRFDTVLHEVISFQVTQEVKAGKLMAVVIPDALIAEYQKKELLIKQVEQCRNVDKEAEKKKAREGLSKKLSDGLQEMRQNPRRRFTSGTPVGLIALHDIKVKCDEEGSIWLSAFEVRRLFAGLCPMPYNLTALGVFKLFKEGDDHAEYYPAAAVLQLSDSTELGKPVKRSIRKFIYSAIKAHSI